MLREVAAMDTEFTRNMVLTDERLDKVEAGSEEHRYLNKKQELSRSIQEHLDALRVDLESYAELIRR